MTIKVTDFENSMAIQGNFDHVIGILDPSMKGHLEERLWKIKNRTMFWFDDTINTSGGLRPPSESHIADIINLIREKELDSIHKSVLIHCAAGISRSTATAIGLLIMRGWSVSQAFENVHIMRPQMWPNELVLKHFDTLLNLDGALIEFDKTWKRDNLLTGRFWVPFDDKEKENEN